jgi:hypothetical protein
MSFEFRVGRRGENEECEMRNELNRNAERRVLSVVPNNSELRTDNSELGKAVDLELKTSSPVAPFSHVSRVRDMT